MSRETISQRLHSAASKTSGHLASALPLPGTSTHCLTGPLPLGWVAETTEKLEMENPASMYDWSFCGSGEGVGEQLWMSS